jgi:GMP synthase-like glutamine amidotransferase
MKRKIGILLTSNDTSDFAKQHPTLGEKFQDLLQPLRPDWTFDVISVKDNIFPASPDAYDGYIITGSPASVNDDEEWVINLLTFIRVLADRNIQTFGSCFGHQAIAVALGGAVGVSAKGWGLGTAKTHFDQFAPWMTPRYNELTLSAAHSEQVTQLPKEAVVLGGDAFCPVGAYRIGNHVFATEYHPEMTMDFISELIDAMEEDLDAATISRAKASLENGNQGKEFAQWIVNFLEYSEA